MPFYKVLFCGCLDAEVNTITCQRLTIGCHSSHKGLLYLYCCCHQCPCAIVFWFHFHVTPHDITRDSYEVATDPWDRYACAIRCIYLAKVSCTPLNLQHINSHCHRQSCVLMYEGTGITTGTGTCRDFCIFFPPCEKCTDTPPTLFQCSKLYTFNPTTYKGSHCYCQFCVLLYGIIDIFSITSLMWHVVHIKKMTTKTPTL